MGVNLSTHLLAEYKFIARHVNFNGVIDGDINALQNIIGRAAGGHSISQSCGDDIRLS